MKRISVRLFSSKAVTNWMVFLLLGIHAALLSYASTQLSPTMLEPASLVAGLSHWEFGRFEVFCVNPPLVRLVAALPVKIAGYNEDWSQFQNAPGTRTEFQMGFDFVKANGNRSIWLFTIARWACLPFSVLGGLFCFFWSRELWRSDLAGLLSLFLWTFEPNILAHGSLVTSDCAAASIGLGASYMYWRWLKFPQWSRAIYAGFFLGLAQLTKTSWLILFILWPIFCLLWLLTSSPRKLKTNYEYISLYKRTIKQLILILLLAIYVLNLGYAFDGSFTTIKRFSFVSKTLTGLSKSGQPGNRFSVTWLGKIPVPVPRDYLRGIDLQKKDFEDYGQLSYLHGQWKRGGWWYYYLYGLAVKTPHGNQLLLVGSLITIIMSRLTNYKLLASCNIILVDVTILMMPAITILIGVSSQLEFNHHLRYVLPIFGFLFVFAGANALWFCPNHSK